MRRLLRWSACALALAFVLPVASRAADVDGPDCGRPITDFGDAPEGLPIWGTGGPIGHYPTCFAPGAPGTQEAVVTPRSTPPGPTGYIRNAQDGIANYWLGCFATPGGLAGIDSEADGKVSTPSGPSACSGIATDGVESLLPFSFGQDESRGDDDAGVPYQLSVFCCMPNTLHLSTANCGADRPAYLNVLVDLNQDGDWNDNVDCTGFLGVGGIAHEWAVKNAQVTVTAGCGTIESPFFNGGTHEGYSWMRVSLTDGPVADDFPWAGSANQPGGSYSGGETEDYPVLMLFGDAARATTWGRLKAIYR
jgi:hypothetical protein